MSGPDPRAGQEAARLLVAAQDWLRTSAPHLAPVGQDGRPCPCPLCRAVAGLRDIKPDAVARWVDSAVAAVISVAEHAAQNPAGDARDVADPEQTSPSGDVVDSDVVDQNVGDAVVGDAGVIDRDMASGDDDPRARGVRRIRLDPGAR